MLNSPQIAYQKLLTMKKEIVIVAAARTPIGSFLGSLSNIAATDLGATAIKGAMAQCNLQPELVEEVLMGNVLQAGLGQAPAKQAAIKAGIPGNVPCTTVNKVCSSGLKSVTQAVQAILCEDAEIVVAGGMENMSLTPHYLHTRQAKKLGDTSVKDGLLLDGLTNVYDQKHMGVCADLCAEKHSISRAAQDEFAINSYIKAQDAWAKGEFNTEVIPVTFNTRKGLVTVSMDEEIDKTNFEKLKTLKPAFSENGTVTAANASKLNDGAAALIIMSAQKATALNLQPLAKIIAYADASQAPELFTTSPALALPKALTKANLNLHDIDFFEINEAFAAVGIANSKLLHLPSEKTNTKGGAVALGHPLGCSGARILTTLVHTLHNSNGTYGAAAICNGGGGATAIIIEKTE